MIDQLETELQNLGLQNEVFTTRMTGCPNGCARPYTGDIGIVGRIPGFYSLYVGGDFEGTRLNQPVADRLALTEIADALDPLFALFAGARLGNEGFGDFCHRVGPEALRQEIDGSRRRTA